jgi:hypothetical protein
VVAVCEWDVNANHRFEPDLGARAIETATVELDMLIGSPQGPLLSPPQAPVAAGDAGPRLIRQRDTVNRENVTSDWLIATNPRGFMCGSTAANDDLVVSSFTRAHELAGHTVARLTFQEARDRLAAITEQVRVAPSVGIVTAHLRWPDHHPTHAGRVALVVSNGFEGLAYLGQARQVPTSANQPCIS